MPRRRCRSLVVGSVFYNFASQKVLLRQILSFIGVGLIAMLVHYGCLIGFVESGIAPAVPATLVGYVAGGLVSYILNRRHTFESERPHEETLWRFVAVAGIGFCLTFVFMHVFVERLALPYLPSQLVTTGIVTFWSFGAHKLWTFGLGAGGKVQT
jgi:putative flippase GtrA